MPSIVSYWQLPDEEEKFLTYLDRSGDILACTWDSVLDPAELEPRPLRAYLSEETPDRVVFAPSEFMDPGYITSYVREERRWYLRYHGKGPLIDYCRPVWRSPQTLGKARLTYVSSVWMTDGVNEDLGYAEPQAPEFLAWARRVLSWMRRHTQRHGYYRATPAVLAELDNGLQLVH